jgi:hypothetical protein
MFPHPIRDLKDLKKYYDEVVQTLERDSATDGAATEPSSGAARRSGVEDP